MQFTLLVDVCGDRLPIALQNPAIAGLQLGLPLMHGAA
jgi:hypothetical protein